MAKDIQVHIWVAMYVKMDVFNNLFMFYWFLFCVYFNRKAVFMNVNL